MDEPISAEVELTTSLPYSTWYYQSPTPITLADGKVRIRTPKEVANTGQQHEVTIRGRMLDCTIVSLENTIEINLPEGGTYNLEFKLVGKPGYESWYSPAGPCPTLSQVHNGILQIITSVQRNGWCRLSWPASLNDFRIGVSEVLPTGVSAYFLSRPNSSIDFTCAKTIKDQVEAASTLYTKRLLEDTVKEMIRRNIEGSKWITKSENSECPISHSEGDLFGCLPCRHRACMNCMISLTLKVSEDCICPECEDPFMIWPFDFDLKMKYFPTTTSTEISKY